MKPEPSIICEQAPGPMVALALPTTDEFTRRRCAPGTELSEMTAGAFAASCAGPTSCTVMPLASIHLACGWLLEKPRSVQKESSALEAWNTVPLLQDPGTLTAAIAKCGSFTLNGTRFF